MASVPRCYDLAQTFYIDSKRVKNSPQVNINSVELYFKSKPKSGELGSENKSGILQPGVNVIFCPTFPDGTPNIGAAIETARLEYNEIAISGDASASTRAWFTKEVYCDTNKEYAIAILADGHEDFGLWTNKKGGTIVGSTLTSSGTTDKYIRNLYTLLDRSSLGSNPASGTTPPGSPNSTTDPIPPTWVPLTDEDLKFKVYICRYADTGPVDPDSPSPPPSTNTNPIIISNKSEFILFDRKLSVKESKARQGELLFQNTSFHTGTISVQGGKLELTGNGVNFNTLYGSDANAYIVIVSESTADAYVNGLYNNFDINVRKIISFNSNTSITVDRLPTITNSAAKFLLPTPVGKLMFMDRSKSFNRRGNSPSWYFSDRNKQDLAVLTDSSANSSVRFVNNNIETITITNRGSGYSNTDYIVVSSSTPGSVNCVANITTNASGSIMSVYITNNGCGMISSPTATVSNSTGGSSAGSSAQFSFREGPTLRTELEKFQLRDCEVIDLEVDAVQPWVVHNATHGTKYHFYHHWSYYKDPQGNYVVNQLAKSNRKLIKNLEKNGFDTKLQPIILSRSNELSGVANSVYSNAQFDLANGSSVNTSISTALEVVASSNNDFICTKIEPPDVIYYTYAINNDYTGENTPFGNAQAKHVSKKITFAEGRLAEDVMVYLRAYRPVGTDIKVFAKVHNSADPEAYDDKDWTLLDCISGADKYSSATDRDDLIEYTYNMPTYPNTQFTSTGLVTVSSGNSEIVGVNTEFQSQGGGFQSGDMVKIYSPIFPQNYWITVVNTVTNATHLTVTDTTTNNNVLGSGLAIDKIGFKHQAFRNWLTDNVARYYNTSMHAFDGYDTVAIKMVMLAESTSIHPEIDDIRMIGVSA